VVRYDRRWGLSNNRKNKNSGGYIILRFLGYSDLEIRKIRNYRKKIMIKYRPAEIIHAISQGMSAD
jgi:hypothetical protein